jgi:hypothetical protein
MLALPLAGLLASPAEAASCSGPACGEINLRTVGACVWVQSQSRDRVDVEARLATGTVTLALVGADPRKADEQAAGKEAGALSPLRCKRAFSGEAARNQLRRQGKVIPDLPEIEGVAAACRRAAAQPTKDAAAQSKGTDETAVHDYAFDPLFPSSKGTPVYRVRLAQGGSCVARMDDVQSYVARYPDRPNAVDPRAAAPSLASLCAGDACGDVSFAEECRARNTGSKPISLTVRAGVYNYERLSLPVGGSVRLTTFSGCVRPHEITRYEASYVK